MSNAVKVMVNSPEVTAEIQDLATQLKAAKQRLKELKAKNTGMTLKRFEYTDKKTGELRSGLSIFGISKRSVNLFAEQAERLFGNTDVAQRNREAIVQWLADNEATLTRKK